MFFSLSNCISKPSDKTGNEYNYLYFSEIVSPIIAGSKKFLHLFMNGLNRSLISAMFGKKKLQLFCSTKQNPA